MLRRPLWLVLALYLAIRLPFIVLLGVTGDRLGPERYQEILSQWVWSGDSAEGLPAEYPPAALLLFALVESAARWLDYPVAFGWTMVLVDLATTLLVAASCRGRSPAPLLAAGVYLGVTSSLWLLVVARYDIVVAACLATALLAVRRHPKGTGPWAWLAVGGALKVAPLVCLPFLGRFLWQRRERWAIGRGVMALLAIGLALTVPWLLFRPAVAVSWLSFAARRGLQIESLYSSLLLLVGMVVDTDYRFGAMELVSPVADRLAILALGAQMAALAAIWFVTARSRQGDEPPDQGLLWLAALLGLVTFGKVLSPQYLLWLAPLAASVSLSPRSYGLVAALTMLAAWLTALVYPFSYRALIEGAPFAAYVLAARNGVLLALFGVLLAILYQQARGGNVASRPLPGAAVAGQRQEDASL